MAELGAVKIPNRTISLVPFAPSRRLDKLVGALDAGKETPNLNNHLIYRFMRPRFDPARARGCPVLIAERSEGPYVLAEGMARMCALLSRRMADEPTSESIPVLRGVSSAASRGQWW